MAASVVSFCHDVEEEGFNIIVQCFMVQEKFCQQTQVLTVDLEVKGESDTPVNYHGTPKSGQNQALTANSQKILNHLRNDGQSFKQSSQARKQARL